MDYQIDFKNAEYILFKKDGHTDLRISVEGLWTLLKPLAEPRKDEQKARTGQSDSS